MIEKHMPESDKPVESAPDEINVSELFGLLHGHRYRLAALAALGALLFLALSFLVTPAYRAYAVVVAAEDNAALQLGEFANLASFAGLSLPGTSQAADRVARLRSRKLAADFVQQQKLLDALLQNKWPLLSLLSSDDLTAERRLRKAVRRFQEDVLSVEQDKEDGVIRIAVDWGSAADAARLANAYVAAVNEDARNRDLQESDKNLEYLRERLQNEPQLELKESVANLIDVELKRGMLARGRAEYAFQLIDPAVPPLDVHRPQRLFFLLGGAMLGFVAGLAWVLRRLPSRASR
jgi:uncharacterized protein involved in exopolysaccharide biosynthesis